MNWLEHAATCFSGDKSRLNVCDAGHDTHARLTVDIDLDGPTPVPDWPKFPSHLTSAFKMMIFDWETYEAPVNSIPIYCTGNDTVSQNIDIYGCWEGFETLLAMDVLALGNPDDLVIDLGCHIGWYSLIAATAGYDVLSVDADSENLELLNMSAKLNGLEDKIKTAYGWIGENTQPLPVNGSRVRLLKADVEGAEDQVLRICAPLFAAGLVDYAFFEVSPELSDHYPDTIAQLMDYDYKVYLIPDKGEPLWPFQDYPLLTATEPQRELTPWNIRDMTVQCNVMLVRGGL